MKNAHPIAIALALLAGAALPAAAQGVYRCGDSYSQQPCPGGKRVEVDDARSAVQKSQTDRAVQRDAKAADTMEKARLKEEGKPAQAILPPAPPHDASAADKDRKPAAKARKTEHFTAVAPRKPGDPAPKKKKKKKNKDDA